MSTPKPELKPELRRLLKMVAAGCVVVAVALAARAYFLEHPPTGSPLVAGIASLQANPLTTLDGVNAELNGDSNKHWGDGITDALHLPPTDGLWILIDNQQGLHVAELTPSALTEKYSLPSNARGVRLYHTLELLYFTHSTNTEDARLVSIDTGGELNLLKLAPGWEFSSVFFEPVQKQFYYNSSARTGESKLQTLRPGSNPLDIAATANYAELEILDVNPDTHTLYFKALSSGRLACTALGLVDKKFSEVDCAGVRTGGGQYTYSTNTPGTVLKTTFKGQILQTNTATGNRQVFAQAAEGEVYSLLATNARQVAAVFSEIEEVAGGLLVVPYSVRQFDPGTHAQTRETPMSDEQVQQILAGNAGGVWLLTEAAAGQQLWQQPDGSETEWSLLEPVICNLGCEFSTL